MLNQNIKTQTNRNGHFICQRFIDHKSYLCNRVTKYCKQVKLLLFLMLHNKPVCITIVLS